MVLYGEKQGLFWHAFIAIHTSTTSTFFSGVKHSLALCGEQGKRAIVGQLQGALAWAGQIREASYII